METKVFKLSLNKLPKEPNPYEVAIRKIYEADNTLTDFRLAATFWDVPQAPTALILVFQKP